LETVDIDDPKVQEMLVGLVGYSIVSAAEADAIIDMANKTEKWVDLNGYGEVGIGYIYLARQ